MKVNLANKITISRILSIPLFILVLSLPNFQYKGWVAAIVFLFASLTDYADGLVARRFHETTKLGRFLDLLADKLLVTAALVFFTNKGVNPWIAYTIIAREYSVLVLRALAASEGEKMKVSILGKLKTVSQCVGILFVILDLAFAQTIMIIVAGITVISGVDYFRRLRHIVMGQF
jgi:CDP-diacylglycerol--glycerol-3-phosphate 3-phosphatidyltransferase